MMSNKRSSDNKYTITWNSAGSTWVLKSWTGVVYDLVGYSRPTHVLNKYTPDSELFRMADRCINANDLTVATRYSVIRGMG